MRTRTPHPSIGRHLLLLALGSGSLFAQGCVTTDLGEFAVLGSGSALVDTGPKLSPATIVHVPGGGVQFVASGGSGTGYVVELIENGSGGMIDSQLFYTAGATAPATDRLRITDSLGAVGYAVVEIVPPVSITPAAETVMAGRSHDFNGVNGVPPYLFAIASDDTGGATINPSTGLLTAGPSAGTIEVTVSDQRGGSAMAAVTVAPALNLTTTPEQRRVMAGGIGESFSATGGVGTLSYSIASAGSTSGGIPPSISAAGAYVPGPGAGTDVIRVTDEDGNFVTVNVTVAAALALSPASEEVMVGKTHAFAASGGDATSAYTYFLSTNGSSSPGASGGSYTAGTVAGTDVITVMDTDGNSTTATITVRPQLTIAPGTEEVMAGRSQAFAGSGGVGNLGYRIKSRGSGPGASVSASGGYTAGSTAGTDEVEVFDEDGNTAVATVTVRAALALNPSSETVMVTKQHDFGATGGVGTLTFEWAPGGRNSGAGSAIDSTTGVYTAGITPDVTDRIQVRDGDGNLVTADIAVRPPLQIFPGNRTVAAGETIQFNAAGGVPSHAFSMVSNASGGSLTGAGTYSAGAGLGTDIVRVTDSDGNTIDTSVTVVKELYVNVNAAGGGDGSPATPYNTINDALAGAAGGGARIYVAAGTYNETVSITGNNIQLIGGFSAALTRDSFDPRVNETVIRGSLVGPVVSISGAGVTDNTVLSGFKIQNTNISGSGSATSPDCVTYGVLVLNGAKPKISRIWIPAIGSEQTMLGCGHAMEISGVGTDPLLTRSVVVGPINYHNESTALAIRNGAKPRVFNNQIFGGQIRGPVTDLPVLGWMLDLAGADNFSVGIRVQSPGDRSSPMIAHNTIHAGAAEHANAVELFGIAHPVMHNNVMILGAPDTADGYGVVEGDATADPISFQNNVIVNNVPGAKAYVDDIGTIADTDSQVDGFDQEDINTGTCSTGTCQTSQYRQNTVLTEAASVQFVDYDGADNQIHTLADNNWNLATATVNSKIAQGGLDTSGDSCGPREEPGNCGKIVIDFRGIERSGAISCGAFQSDEESGSPTTGFGVF